MDFGSPFWGITIDLLRLEHGAFVFEIPYRYQCPSIYILVFIARLFVQITTPRLLH